MITVGLSKPYPNRITWLTKPIPYIETLPKRALFWWRHENLENFYKRSIFKIWHVVKYSTRNLTRFKKLIWNLTRRKKFDSKSHQTEKIYFKTMPCTKFFSFKIRLFRKTFFFKIVLSKTAPETQKLRILRGKLNEIEIYYVQSFLQNLLWKINFSFNIILFKNLSFLKIWGVVKKFNSKCNALYFFQSKIWRVVKLLNENWTRWDKFVSKSDALENFFQNLTSSETSSPKSDFYLVFQVLIEWWYVLSTLIPTYFKEEK